MQRVRFTQLDMGNGSTLVTGKMIYQGSLYAANGLPCATIPDFNIDEAKNEITNHCRAMFNRDAADAIAYIIPSLKVLLSPLSQDFAQVREAAHDVAMFIHRIEHEHRVEAT